MKKKFLLSTFLMFMMVLSLMMGSQLNASAAPVAQSSGPTITSDQADYQAGSTVTLTGAGWQPGESVHIFVNDDAGQTWSHTADVAAAADGTITDMFQL